MSIPSSALGRSRSRSSGGPLPPAVHCARDTGDFWLTGPPCLIAVIYRTQVTRAPFWGISFATWAVSFKLAEGPSAQAGRLDVGWLREAEQCVAYAARRGAPVSAQTRKSRACPSPALALFDFGAISFVVLGGGVALMGIVFGVFFWFFFCAIRQQGVSNSDPPARL